VKFRYAGLCAPFFAALFAVVLTPSSVLADANPNNHGHHYHYGWVHHHSPPPPAPTPQPGGGPATNGLKNSIVAVAPAAVAPAAAAPQGPTVSAPDLPVVAPPDIVPAARPLPAGRDVWLVAILLAAFVAANVAAIVLLTGRGGHYAIRRALAPLGIRV